MLESLDCYLVGGWVRDWLLGIAPQDEDYVVVGSSRKKMLRLGFKEIHSKSFPVFHYPETMEEFALARRERSIGDGYGDFEFVTEGVTLREDLGRRDFTINAMAMAKDCSVIDLYGGKDDLDAGIIHHISDGAFQEDPLRILRGARFASTYQFAIHEETVALCQNMCIKGMLQTLPKERIWQETTKALMRSPVPSQYFRWLDKLGALECIFKPIKSLQGLLQNPIHHPEGDVYEHSLCAMDCILECRVITRWAALCHDLGKLKTPAEERPQYKGHTKLGGNIVCEFCKQIGTEKGIRNFSALVAKEHMKFHRLEEMRAGSVVKLLNKLNVRHSSKKLIDYITICCADEQAKGSDVCPDNECRYLILASDIMRNTKGKPELGDSDKIKQVWLQEVICQIKKLKSEMFD